MNRKIFLSGTYIDLEKIRKDLIETLRPFGSQLLIETMEHFSPSDKNALQTSLERLGECSAYVALIGGRYGTIPFGEDLSITHFEFREALKRGLSIAVFIQDPPIIDAGPDGTYREDDTKWRKRIEFINEIKRSVLPVSFKDSNDLIKKLPEIIVRYVTHETISEPQSIRVFSAEEAAQIFEEADERFRKKIGEIEDFFSFVAFKFRDIFHIDQSDFDIHPLFKDFREKLTPIVPGIQLSNKTGQLTRAGIRHVLLRSATMQQILMHYDASKLREVGANIGGTAATDLLTMLNNNKAIPNSSQAFVTLWDYWDATGGWGTLQLEMPEQQFGGEGYGEATIWRIRLLNSVLRLSPQDTNEPVEQVNKRLANFWSGYIQGFLNTALPLLSQTMEREFTHEQYMSEIQLPAFKSAREVEHLIDGDADIFIVKFKELPETDSLIRLSRAQRSLDRGEYGRVWESLSLAYKEIQELVGPEAFAEAVGQVSDSDLPAILAKTQRPPNYLSGDEAKRDFKCARQVITICAGKLRKSQAQVADESPHNAL